MRYLSREVSTRASCRSVLWGGRTLVVSGPPVMRRALSRVSAIYVRDQDSKNRLEKLSLVCTRVEVVVDPAILASSVFKVPVRTPVSSSTSVVGLGVIAPQVIRRHVLDDGGRSREASFEFLVGADPASGWAREISRSIYKWSAGRSSIR